MEHPAEAAPPSDPDAPGNPQAPDGPGTEPPAREPTFIINLSIVLLVALFLAMVLVLYKQWIGPQPPSAVLVVRNIANADGVVGRLIDTVSHREIAISQPHDSHTIYFVLDPQNTGDEIQLRYPDGKVESHKVTSFALKPNMVGSVEWVSTPPATKTAR